MASLADAAELSCKLVLPDYDRIECKTAEGQSYTGWVDGDDLERIQAKKVILSVGMRDAIGLGIADFTNYSEGSSVKIPVELSGSGEKLSLFTPQTVYYGASKITNDKKEAEEKKEAFYANNEKTSFQIPAEISESEFIQRYVEKGASLENAQTIVQTALPVLLALPVDHVARPGTLLGGQSLYALEFLTESELFLYNEKVSGYGAIIEHAFNGDGLPGDSDVGKSSETVAGVFQRGQFRVDEDKKRLFFKAEDDLNWKSFMANRPLFENETDDHGRSRYVAQVERSIDQNPDNIQLVPENPNYYYYEGYYGRWVYFLVLDSQTGTIVKSHRTYLWTR